MTDSSSPRRCTVCRLDSYLTLHTLANSAVLGQATRWYGRYEFFARYPSDSHVQRSDIAKSKAPTRLTLRDSDARKTILRGT